MLNLTELGKRLKEAREEKNIDLDELQKITKIQKRYLVGIEEGDYSVMPGKFYIRAFIKQYAEAVGLHPDEILEEHKAELPSTVNDELPSQLSRVRTRKQISTKGSKVLDMIPMVILGLFIIGGLVAFWWFQQNRDIAEQPDTNIDNELAEYQESDAVPPENDEKAVEGSEEEATDVEEEETKTETPAEEDKDVQELTLIETSGNNSTYELTNTDVFNVKVSAPKGGETWVDIKNQKQKKFFYGMIRDGQTEELPLTEESQIIFNIGRTTETNILINDEEFEFPIDPSKAVTQIITVQFKPSSTEGE